MQLTNTTFSASGGTASPIVDSISGFENAILAAGALVVIVESKDFHITQQ